jgi:hypothetical protein
MSSSGFQHIATHTIGNVVGSTIKTPMAPLRSDGISPKRNGEVIHVKYSVKGYEPRSPREVKEENTNITIPNKTRVNSHVKTKHATRT